MIAIAAAIGVLAATAVAPSPASAGIGGIDISDNDRFAPVLVDDKPCANERFQKYVCSPDYVASIDESRVYNVYYRGERATVFSMTVFNDSTVDGAGDLTSSLDSTHAILGFDNWAGNSDWEASPDQDYHGTRWTLTSPDGLDAGEYTAIWVYVSGWDANLVQLKVNGYWGYDCCSQWFYFDQLEPSTDNNYASIGLNYPAGK